MLWLFALSMISPFVIGRDDSSSSVPQSELTGRPTYLFLATNEIGRYNEVFGKSLREIHQIFKIMNCFKSF